MCPGPGGRRHTHSPRSTGLARLLRRGHRSLGTYLKGAHTHRASAGLQTGCPQPPVPEGVEVCVWVKQRQRAEDSGKPRNNSPREHLLTRSTENSTLTPARAPGFPVKGGFLPGHRGAHGWERTQPALYFSCRQHCVLMCHTAGTATFPPPWSLSAQGFPTYQGGRRPMAGTAGEHSFSGSPEAKQRQCSGSRKSCPDPRTPRSLSLASKRAAGCLARDPPCSV